MEKKEITTILYVEPKQFTNKDGVICDYLDCSITIDNQVIKITIQKDSKRLFKYLIAKV